jgi:hypothetical protein
MSRDSTKSYAHQLLCICGAGRIINAEVGIFSARCAKVHLCIFPSAHRRSASRGGERRRRRWRRRPSAKTLPDQQKQGQEHTRLIQTRIGPRYKSAETTNLAILCLPWRLERRMDKYTSRQGFGAYKI